MWAIGPPKHVSPRRSATPSTSSAAPAGRGSASASGKLTGSGGGGSLERRQREAEGGAFAERAANRHLAAVHVHQGLGDGQAEPGARHTHGGLVASAEELGKQLLLVFLG